jgi:hypothetical protein
MILLKAKEILMALPTVVDITIPEGGHVTVFGDIHGQYYDMVNIFKNHTGLPSPTNPMVFNGDLVDRGSWGVEVILLLLAYKVQYPDSVHIARGNHETKNMNQVYGFSGEVKAKYPLTKEHTHTHIETHRHKLCCLNYIARITKSAWMCLQRSFVICRWCTFSTTRFLLRMVGCFRKTM